MINANEARKIAEANNTDESLNEVVERVMPIMEKAIRHMCGIGGKSTLVMKKDIANAAGFSFLSNRQIMDGVRNELESYGFKTSIPESYSSIHVNW